MNVLVAYSSKVLGHDGIINEIREDLSLRKFDDSETHVTVINVDELDSENALQNDYGALIFIDALDWYTTNRLKIVGQPWICVVSFSFASLVSLMQTAISDTGINTLFSNSTVFVDRCGPTVPAMFTWKPIHKPVSGLTIGDKIGCVLQNIEDRDFCLLDLVYKELKKLGKEDRFVIYLDANEKGRLPDSLQESGRVIPYFFAQESDQSYFNLEFYIPAPRITDYRVGMIPPEYIKAMHYGCKPLLLWHPALQPLNGVITPIFSSLKDYREAIREVATSSKDIIVKLPENYVLTTDKFSKGIVAAYQRWKTNASSS
jgi:hypothetical protein